jgi:hypothetical protein
MKSSVFWYIVLSPAKVNQHAGFLLLFNPESGGDMILQSVARLSLDYKALHPQRQKSS